MNVWHISIIIIFSLLTFGALFKGDILKFWYFNRVFGKYRNGVYHAPNGEHKEVINVKWFKEFIPRAKKLIRFVAGEMNPVAYEQVMKEFEVAAQNGVKTQIVFGPKLAVRDQKKDELLNKKISIKDVHPVFQLASRYPEQFELYIPVDGKRQDIHCGVVDSIHSCIEDPHDELDERGITFYEGEPNISKEIDNDISGLINKGKAGKIAIDEFPYDFLVTISEIEDQEVRKKDIIPIMDKLDDLKRDISTLLKAS
jgi:hypothetical protein